MDEKNIVVPKKRGRKPKIKPVLTEEEKKNEKPQPLKKRGRKPQKKVYNVCKETNPVINTSNTDLILHLNITKNDIDDLNNKNELLETEFLRYSPTTIKEPEPYEPNNMMLKLIDDNNEELTEQSSEFKNTEQKNNSNPKNITKPIVERKPIISNNFMKKSTFIQHSDGILYTDGNAKIKRIYVSMDELVSKTKIPQRTNIHCYWDCHPFNNPPCMIPEKYENNIFTVYGCFCSCECAAAYIMKYNDYCRAWEQYSLLNTMNNIINNSDVKKKIQLAPPRECLNIFGGYMDIDRFRSNNNVLHNIINYPMIIVTPQIEETENIEANFSKYISNFNKNKETSELRLKRNKPLPNHKMSITNCMNAFTKNST